MVQRQGVLPADRAVAASGAVLSDVAVDSARRTITIVPAVRRTHEPGFPGGKVVVELAGNSIVVHRLGQSAGDHDGVAVISGRLFTGKDGVALTGDRPQR